MKALFNVSTLIVSLALSISAAQAMGFGQVKENYESEAAATLDYLGINSSSYFIECIPAHDGETAICNALASNENGRDSISMFGERTYDVETGEFTGLIVSLRRQAPELEGSVYRY